MQIKKFPVLLSLNWACVRSMPGFTGVAKRGLKYSGEQKCTCSCKSTKKIDDRGRGGHDWEFGRNRAEASCSTDITLYRPGCAPCEQLCSVQGMQASCQMMSASHCMGQSAFTRCGPAAHNKKCQIRLIPKPHLLAHASNPYLSYPHQAAWSSSAANNRLSAGRGGLGCVYGFPCRLG